VGIVCLSPFFVIIKGTFARLEYFEDCRNDEPKGSLKVEPGPPVPRLDRLAAQTNWNVKAVIGGR
jgi:hypothetical protein